MILARGGEDAKTHVPPGGRVPVHLTERIAVSATAMPVIGIVARDYVQGDIVAIPAGSKLLGQVTFDANGDRAKVEWQSIEFESGQQHQFSAVGIGSDGQLGVQGNIQSNAAENIIGATLTRFIGAYAEGSMERGALGGNPGGSDNGRKNAVSETAKDQADAFAETLKKEKRWIELDPGMEFFAVLTSSFTFREVGATYGR
jgi:type IV secretory pathway VirB10-like protein